jgi:hypothetical protein
MLRRAQAPGHGSGRNLALWKAPWVRDLMRGPRTWPLPAGTLPRRPSGRRHVTHAILSVFTASLAQAPWRGLCVSGGTTCSCWVGLGVPRASRKPCAGPGHAQACSGTWAYLWEGVGFVEGARGAGPHETAQGVASARGEGSRCAQWPLKKKPEPVCYITCHMASPDVT